MFDRAWSISLTLGSLSLELPAVEFAQNAEIVAIVGRKSFRLLSIFQGNTSIPWRFSLAVNNIAFRSFSAPIGESGGCLLATNIFSVALSNIWFEDNHCDKFGGAISLYTHFKQPC
jgi:hypothetical protein